MTHACPGELCAVCRLCGEFFDALDEIYMRVVETILAVLYDIQTARTKEEEKEKDEEKARREEAMTSKKV